MIEVPKAEFFSVINQLNVHPRPEPKRSVWEMLDGTRSVVGITTPGYLDTNTPVSDGVGGMFYSAPTYSLTESFAGRVKRNA